jgi:tRNA nucleotidyltransferase (CCA-adding enzyme)
MRLQVRRYPELIRGRDDERPTAWLLWLLVLSKKQIESLDKRLHFTAPLLKALLAASKLFADLSLLVDRKPSECVEYLDELPLLAVYAVYIASPDGKSKFVLEKYLKEWRHVRPKITGHDLKRRGLPPGPKYRKILRDLRNAWLDEEVQDIEAEKRRLEETLRGS